MPFIPVYYNISISSIAGDAPSDGFVDNTTVQEYIQQGDTNLPTSVDLSLAKTRANYRWQFILQQCSLLLNPLYTLDITATGATVNAPATSFSFTIAYDRPDYLNTEDELNPGTYLTNADAIKRFVARALCEQRTTNALTFNPTQLAGIPSPSASSCYGESVQELTIGPLATDLTTAEASITVVQVQNT